MKMGAIILFYRGRGESVTWKKDTFGFAVFYEIAFEISENVWHARFITFISSEDLVDATYSAQNQKKKIRPEGSAFRYYRNNIPFADRIHHHGIFFYKFFLYRRQSMEWTNLIESIEFLSMLTFLISIDVIIFI